MTLRALLRAGLFRAATAAEPPFKIEIEQLTREPMHHFFGPSRQSSG